MRTFRQSCGCRFILISSKGNDLRFKVLLCSTCPEIEQGRYLNPHFDEFREWQKINRQELEATAENQRLPRP